MKKSKLLFMLQLYSFLKKKKKMIEYTMTIEMRTLLLQNNVKNNLSKIDMIILFLSSRKLHQYM